MNNGLIIDMHHVVKLKKNRTGGQLLARFYYFEHTTK